jgi:SIR2-like domain
MGKTATAKRGLVNGNGNSLDPFKPLSYCRALDHLRVGYRRGLLVPFVGSGLSAPRLHLWSGLVKALAEKAGIGDVRLGDPPTDQQLIVASERIVWSLRAQGLSLADAIQTTLPNRKSSQDEVPPAARALASAWWPLVLTTNYDSLLLDAFNEGHQRAKHSHGAMAVVGRSAADCHTVLASLNLPTRPLLWALQGFLGSSLNRVDLKQEMVLGYDHYRRATFESASFRAAFSEVYRNRSLLFAGAGLGEEYFRGLFGESIVRLGANQHAHCALINEKDLTPDMCWFMHTRLNIVVLTYKDTAKERYSGFAPCLQEIADALTEPPRGGRRFWVHRAKPAVCVDIEPTSLPRRGTATHWIVGSAGQKRSGELRVSGDVPTRLRQPQVPVSGNDDLKRVKGQSVLLAIARASDPDTDRRDRDLRNVADVTAQALQFAVRQGASTVSFMLLSASVHAGRWPRVFSLVQMLRGIRRFVQDPLRESSPLRIVIHDTAAARLPGDAPDRSAWHAVETGRLDPAEVLDCSALRFFVEVEIEGSTTRTPMYVNEKETVQQVSQYFQLDIGWGAVLEPSPAPRRGNRVPELAVSLLDAGVVPGSTLRFTRR